MVSILAAFRTGHPPDSISMPHPARTPAPFGLLLDVDGPIAHTATRAVRIPSITDDLAALANAGVPVVFNTGRSDAFLAERVLPDMIDAGLRADAAVWGVCEKGATWFALAGGDAVAIGDVQVAEGLRPPQALIDECRALTEANADLIMWDGTKRTMISTEQRTDVTSERYLAFQPGFIERLDALIRRHGVADAFRTAPNIIAVDVEHVSVGKALGADRALAMLAERMPPPRLWRTAGDSRSDYAMADRLHELGYEVEHLDVRPGEGVPEVPYRVIHSDPDDPDADEDAVTARYLTRWRRECGV